MTEERPGTVFQRSGRPTAPLGRAGRSVVAALGAVALLGLGAWINQLVRGLGETGMKNSTSWGVYVANVVFFIGISHAGTLISAVLRLTRSEWRRPITRIAEAVTVVALFAAALQIVVDLGRPGRVANLLVSGRLASPLMWDVLCVAVYFLSCVFYLGLPLIPDVGDLSRHPAVSPGRRRLYRLLSPGWQGTDDQRARLERAIGVMAILIIPIMISVHTVVAWVFGMTVRPMWHSTILGPYFVTGAVFSGVAVVVLAMAAARRFLRLDQVLEPLHFHKLGGLLLVLSCVWFYLTLSEFVTTGYGGLREEVPVFEAKVRGQFAVLFWAMVLLMAAAFVTLLIRKKRPVATAVVASSLIVVAMWLERLTIVVPTLTHAAEEGYRAGVYRPTVTEWAITAGSLSAFLLLLIGFMRVFPAISMWEMHSGTPAGVEIEQPTEAALSKARAVEAEPIPRGVVP